MAFGAATAGVVALVLAPAVLRRAPERLTRRNVNGRDVAAVLGLPLVMGSLGGLLILDVTTPGDLPEGGLPTIGLVLIVMGAAGWWDDLRGDERDRGFQGHLAALARGNLTGGLVKIGAGGAAGGAAALLTEGGAGERVMLALIVPLAANLVNLLDRAPGRAGKVALLLLGIAATVGPAGSAALMGPVAAALVVVLAWDLRERAMLGDAGANALGAAAGVGLGLAFEGAGRGVVLALLMAANLASERWSFSSLIERSRVLKRLDGLGRRGS